MYNFLLEQNFDSCARAHLLTVLLPPPSVASSRWFPNRSPLTDPPEPELELIIASCRLRLEDDVTGASATSDDNGSSGIVDAVESCDRIILRTFVTNE